MPGMAFFWFPRRLALLFQTELPCPFANMKGWPSSRNCGAGMDRGSWFLFGRTTVCRQQVQYVLLGVGRQIALVVHGSTTDPL